MNYVLQQQQQYYNNNQQQQEQYESLTIEYYMSACGCSNSLHTLHTIVQLDGWVRMIEDNETPTYEQLNVLF
jgi:hypothetical protein